MSVDEVESQPEESEGQSEDLDDRLPVSRRTNAQVYDALWFIGYASERGTDAEPVIPSGTIAYGRRVWKDLLLAAHPDKGNAVPREDVLAIMEAGATLRHALRYGVVSPEESRWRSTGFERDSNQRPSIVELHIPPLCFPQLPRKRPATKGSAAEAKHAKLALEYDAVAQAQGELLARKVVLLNLAAEITAFTAENDRLLALAAELIAKASLHVVVVLVGP